MKETPLPFHGATVRLEVCSLVPLDLDYAKEVSRRVVSMDPWKILGYTEDGLLSYLTRPDPGLARYRISVGGETAGAVCIRYPWLLGPLLELICVLEPFQGRGLGSAILDWMAEEAGGACSNLWISVSSFNQKARGFYRKSGFLRTGVLKDLLKCGYDEILLRRQIR